MIKQKGVTLIELLIVVAIIGVLSSIGAVVFDYFKDKTYRDIGCVQMAPRMAVDLKKYKSITGEYTTDFTDLNAKVAPVEPWEADPADTKIKYTFSITPGRTGDIKTSFEIVCTPDDPDGDGYDHTGCGVLKYDTYGRKDATFQAPMTVEKCWR